MRPLKLLAVVAMCTNLAFAQAKPAQDSAKATQSTPAPMGGFDITALDRSVDACSDFYKFACGGWMAKNPVPGDQTRWGRFDELGDRNLEALRGLLEQAAAKKSRSAVEQKVGDYYAACMDTATIQKLGTKPIQPILDRIAAMKDKAALIDTAAYLTKQNVNVLFGFGPSPDLHNAQMMVANVIQGGTSLPDRDYYIKDEPRFKETRQKYFTHVQKMLELLGDAPDTAAAEADAVMRIETALAHAQMDRTLLRDPKNRDHMLSVSEIASVAPRLELMKFFEGIGAPKIEKVNVVSPDFFKAVSQQLESTPLEDWKAYYRWRVVRSFAPVLPEPFVMEQFNFDNAYLSGQKEIQPRWKRCVKFTDGDLGEALGQLYVEKYFGADGKKRTLAMVDAIEKAMAADLKTLDWMSEETKKKAYEKLNAIRNNIGYPDKWRDYSTVAIKRDDAIGNTLRAGEFEDKRQLAKIGKPVDRTEWSMSPPTVNAYYRPSMNDINFPAGILQPPFFDKQMDDAVNFGAIGAVVGHELTHGFDDQGSKFSADGNFTNWWSEQDLVEFNKRTNCLAEQYSKYSPVEGVNLNGKLTLGENTADNGGVRLAFMALEDRLKQKEQPKVDGFTPEQRFFLGYAQIWCQNVRPERAKVLALTDPHSPGRFRVNGVVVNMPEFQNAFGCKPDQAMVSPNACRVW